MDKCAINENTACPNSMAIALLRKRVDGLEDGQAREESFRKTYYEDRDARNIRDANLDAKINSMDEKLDGVKSWVEEQRCKPVKRWEAIVEKIIFAIVGAFITWVLAKTGMLGG